MRMRSVPVVHRSLLVRLLLPSHVKEIRLQPGSTCSVVKQSRVSSLQAETIENTFGAINSKPEIRSRLVRSIQLSHRRYEVLFAIFFSNDYCRMLAFRASSTGELQKEAQFLRYYLCFWMACYLLLLVLRSETIFDTDQAAAFKRNSSAFLGPAGDADRCRVVLQSSGFNVF